jgi:hypothetical protein
MIQNASIGLEVSIWLFSRMVSAEEIRTLYLQSKTQGDSSAVHGRNREANVIIDERSTNNEHENKAIPLFIRFDPLDGRLLGGGQSSRG